MEWLAQILTSPNALIAIGGVFALVILLAILAKKGIVSLNRFGLKIGKQESEIERSIIRTQIQWLESDVKDIYNDLPEKDKMDEYKAKYTIERMFDEMLKIVYFNHVCLEPTYISLKQDILWNTVQEINPTWNKLEGFVKERTKVAIQKIYEIRKYYDKVE